MVRLLTLSIVVLFMGLSAVSAGAIKARAGWTVIDTRQTFPALTERLEATINPRKWYW